MAILKSFLRKFVDKKFSCGVKARHTFIGFNFATVIIACLMLFVASDYMRNFTLGLDNFNNYSSVLAFLVFVTSLVGICMGEVKSPPIWGLIFYLMFISALTIAQIAILAEYISFKLDGSDSEVRTYYSVVQYDEGNEFGERVDYDSRDVEVAGENEKIDVRIIAITSALITVQVRKMFLTSIYYLNLKNYS